MSKIISGVSCSHKKPQKSQRISSFCVSCAFLWLLTRTLLNQSREQRRPIWQRVQVHPFVSRVCAAAHGTQSSQCRDSKSGGEISVGSSASCALGQIYSELRG